MTSRADAGGAPRLLWLPAALAVALLVLPVVALVVRADWATLPADVTSPAAVRALGLSLSTSLVATGLCLLFGAPLAVVLARRSGWSADWLRALVTLPLVLPPTVGGIALLFLLGRRGVIGQTLDDWFGLTIPFTTAAVVIAQTFVAMPFLVLGLEGALRTAGTRYETVAATLGAGRWTVLRRVTLPLAAPGLVSGLVLCFARALGEFGAALDRLPGVDLFIDGEVPIGAGLSSSAALESSVALALDEHWGLGLDRETLARVGRLAENRVVGAPTGIMDQAASLLGEADSAVFIDCRSLDAEVVPLGFDADGLRLVVIDTRVSHAHATGGYAARRASCEAGARLLGVDALRDVSVADLDRAARLLDDETFRRVRHIVTEDQRVLDTVRALREHGPTAIGPLLDASHASMRDDFEISTPELDLAVATAQANGAIGARMTGGGFGGSAIALVIEPLVPVLERAVRAAFAEERYREPAIFTVRPSAGARRDA